MMNAELRDGTPRPSFCIRHSAFCIVSRIRVLTLLVLQGPDKGRRFELPDAHALVGRESRQLPITDNTVSRKHCELFPGDDNQWILKDLGSANGTWINGQRVERTAALKLGD